MIEDYNTHLGSPVDQPGRDHTPGVVKVVHEHWNNNNNTNSNTDNTVNKERGFLHDGIVQQHSPSPSVSG